MAHRVIKTATKKMAHPTLFLFLFLLSSLLPSSFSATAGNILLTGDIYPLAGEIHSIPINAFLNNNDYWSLAHRNNDSRSQSNARQIATNFTLNLTDRGQLLIQSPAGSTAWSSPPGKTGLYAALFRPDGHVTVYGPSVWSTQPRVSVTGRTTGIAEIPVISRNFMVSSQVIDDTSNLASGEHVLSMNGGDCNLELVRATEGVVWESGTKGMGRNCFARLDHRGQIAIVNDRLKVVWATKAEEEGGVYVLVVRNDGRAAVYGPAIWSTVAS